MTPVGVFFCWQGGAERDFVNSTKSSRPSLVIIAFAQGGSLHLVPLLQNLKDGFHLSFVCKDGEQEDIQDV